MSNQCQSSAMQHGNEASETLAHEWHAYCQGLINQLGDKKPTAIHCHHIAQSIQIGRNYWVAANLRYPGEQGYMLLSLCCDIDCLYRGGWTDSTDVIEIAKHGNYDASRFEDEMKEFATHERWGQLPFVERNLSCIGDTPRTISVFKGEPPQKKFLAIRQVYGDPKDLKRDVSSKAEECENSTSGIVIQDEHAASPKATKEDLLSTVRPKNKLDRFGQFNHVVDVIWRKINSAKSAKHYEREVLLLLVRHAYNFLAIHSDRGIAEALTCGKTTANRALTSLEKRKLIKKIKQGTRGTARAKATGSEYLICCVMTQDEEQNWSDTRKKGSSKRVPPVPPE